MNQRFIVVTMSSLALLSCGSNSDVGGGADSDPCDACIDGACPAACTTPAGAWEGPVLLWQGKEVDAPDCPDEAPELLVDGYADFNDSPLRCGACSCGPSLCSLPKETRVSTTDQCILADPDIVYMSISAPEGWNGACAVVPTVDTNEFRSVVYYGTKLSECLPQQAPPEAFPPDVPWDTFVRVCRTAAPLVDCGDPTGACFQPLEPSPSSFARCIRSVTGDAPCPAAYPQERVLYAGADDTRACTPCTCGPQRGGVCLGDVKMWGDDACTQYRSGMYLNPTAMLGCSVVVPNSELNAMNGRFLDVEPGVCDPLGGEPVGEAMPLDPTVFCCEAPVD